MAARRTLVVEALATLLPWFLSVQLTVYTSVTNVDQQTDTSGLKAICTCDTAP